MADAVAVALGKRRRIGAGPACVAGVEQELHRGAGRAHQRVDVGLALQRRLLVEEGGFLYDSDAYDDELPYWTEVEGKAHLVVPYTLTNNDSRFMSGQLGTGDDFFAFLRDAFDMLYREGQTAPKMMSVGMHMRLLGHPARAAGLERFLDYVKRHDGVWVTRRLDIARHWTKTHPS